MIMSNNINTPRLRFPEFSGEWEEKKLGDVATKMNRRNSQLEVSRVLTNSANAGIVDQNEYFDRDIAVKDNTANYHIVEIEDFVYNPRISTAAPVGPISVNKIGRGIMSPLYTVFKIRTGCISFFEQYFQTTIWHSYLKSIANFGARFDRMNITSEGFFSMPLLLPSQAEQEKIAECLTEMDNLISAQTQKVDALKEKKKGLMQQLFPQPGQTTPKLRFPGFTGDWEEKKLGEVATINPRTESLPERFIYIDLESVESGVLLKNNLIESKNAPSRAQRLLKCGDIIFQMVRPYQKNNYHFFKKDDEEYVASTGYAQIRYNDCSSYLYYYLHTDAFVGKVIKKCVGGNYPAINSTDLSNIMVVLPPTLPEQQKIAECLTSLDELIVAESAELDALKEHKKGLMQQMFPIGK